MIAAGRRFALTMGSDVDRDGMFLELDDVTGDVRVTVAEVFYSDVDGSFTLTQYHPGQPAAALDWLRAEALRRLPPSSDAV